MAITIAGILIFIFLGLAGIHIYWGFGGKWGSQAVIPTKTNHEKVIMPGIVPTLLVAFVLVGFGAVVFLNVMAIKNTSSFWMLAIQKYGLWVLASIFFVRAIGEFNYVGFFKRHKQTTFAQNDTKYYSPLCLVIALLAILLVFLK